MQTGCIVHVHAGCVVHVRAERRPESVQDRRTAAASNIGDVAWRRKEKSPMQIDDVNPYNHHILASLMD